MELVVVVVILSVLTAIMVPSLIGYIEKTKVQLYVVEATKVRNSMDLYLVDHYGEDMENMIFLEPLTTAKAAGNNSSVLADYLLTVPTRGAVIENVSLNKKRTTVKELIYCVDHYRISVYQDHTKVEDMREN